MDCSDSFHILSWAVLPSRVKKHSLEAKVWWRFFVRQLRLAVNQPPTIFVRSLIYSPVLLPKHLFAITFTYSGHCESVQLTRKKGTDKDIVNGSLCA